tara:strand:+ start:340 stop:441 length:102 start_codon:yes stop_codon:yes gene_type:complete
LHFKLKKILEESNFGTILDAFTVPDYSQSVEAK